MQNSRRHDLPPRVAMTEETMRQLMRTALHMLDDGLGVAILVFEFGPGGIMSYVSNAQREDMIKALREQADRLEIGAGDTVGRGEC